MGGSAMTRTEWVERIQRGWWELDELVAVLDAAALEAPMADGWRVKDHLAHLAAWEESLVALLEGRDREAAVGVSGIGKADVDSVNAAILERHREDSPAQAVASLRDTHRRLLAKLDQLGEEDLSRPYSHYQPGSSSHPDREKPVSDWVGVNTFEHYAEHLPLIRSAASSGA
jgi:uncharacterized protein (TIGR03083 family)